MPPAHELHQLFFALWPGEGTREQLAAAARGLRAQGARGRWIDPRRYHLTLHFLGRHPVLDAGLCASARSVGSSVALASFDWVLDRAGSFAHARIPAWLGCARVPAGLQALWHALAEGLHAQGLRVQADAFVPHVTVLRDADSPVDRELPEPVHWRVDDFVLVDSRIQPFAPYRIIGRWPLR